MSSQADREIIEALLRQASPYDYPTGAPDLMSQLGAKLEGAGQKLESSLQAENELERFAELIPRWLIANPAKRTGALMRDPEGALEQLKTMVAQAKADPGAAAQAVGRAGIEAVKDPLGTAEGMSALEMLGAGGALTSLAKAGMRLRGPDLVESVMPEAKVERPKPRTGRSQELMEESVARGEVPGETGKADMSRQIGDAIHRGDLNMDSVGDADKYDALMRKIEGFTEFDKLPDIEKARLDRAAQQGFNIDAFHGTKGDISAFDPGLSGATTGAPSARKGFFFSADPETASTYADAASRNLRDDRPRTYEEPASWEGMHPINRREAELEDAMIKANKSRMWADAEYNKWHHSHKDKLDEGGNYRLEYLNQPSSPEMKDFMRKYDAVTAWRKKLYDTANKARSDYDNFFIETREFGKNIMPVKLKLQNPLEHDFKSSSYRETTYNDLLERAQREGRDGAIFRNTIDGGPVTDVYVVFDPSQIRSRYAMFDPEKSASGEVIAGAAPVVLPLGAGAAAEAYMANQEQ